MRLNFNKISVFYSALFIAMLAFIVRISGISLNTIWGDEAFSYFLSIKNPLNILAGTAADVHPPFYYILLNSWIKVFGNSEIAIRSLSVVLGSLAVLVGYFVIRMLLDNKKAVVISVACLLNPFLIYYSWEVRMYSLLLLLILISSYYILKISALLERKNLNVSSLIINIIAYSISASLMFYTQYYGFIFFSFQLVYLVVKHRNGMNRIFYQSLALCFFIPILLFMPWMATMLAQLSRGTGLEWLSRTTILTLPSSMLDYFSTISSSNFATTVMWLWILLIGYILTRGYKRELLYFHCMSWPILLLVIIISIRKPIFHPRYLIGFGYFITALIIASIYNLKNSHFKLLAIVSIIPIFIVGDIKIFIRPADKYKKINKFIATNYRPEDSLVILSDKFGNLPMRFYHKNISCLRLGDMIFMDEGYNGSLQSVHSCMSLDQISSARVWVFLNTNQEYDLQRQLGGRVVLRKSFKDKHLVLIQK